MPKVSTPIVLSSYPSEQSDVYTFLFEVLWDESVQNPDNELAFELQIDNQLNFASPNLKEYSSSNSGLVSFQGGRLFKAFEVPLPYRVYDAIQTRYWRVRINKSTFVSDWSEVGILSIDKNISHVTSRELSDDLADGNAYNKSKYSSNIDILFRMFGREYDRLDLENILTRKDVGKDSARDRAFTEKFGELMSLEKSVDETYAEYRGKVLKIYRAFLLYGGLEQGIIECVKAFTGVDPLITDYSTLDGWILGLSRLFDPAFPDSPDPVIILSRDQKGFYWSLRIYNHWDLTYDRIVLQEVIYDIMPKHTKVVFFFDTTKNTASTFNIKADWDSCTLSNIDTTTYTDYAVLSGGNTGTILTPVIDATSNISAFDQFEAEDTPSGQTVTYEIRSSSDSISWTGWNPLYKYRIPTVDIQRYFQIRVTLTSVDWTTYKPLVKLMKQKYIRS